MNIVYGGSFNPVTKAHLEIIKKLRNKFNPENIIVVPTYNNYLRKEMIDYKFRKEMLELCNDGYIISDFESQQTKYRGTLYTLNNLSKKYEDLYFCLGADNLNDLDTWINYLDLLNNYKFIVFSRVGFNIKNIIHSKYEKYENKFYILDFDFEISSSMIRTNVSKYKKYLDKRVYNYISKNNLYSKE